MTCHQRKTPQKNAIPCNATHQRNRCNQQKATPMEINSLFILSNTYDNLSANFRFTVSIYHLQPSHYNKCSKKQIHIRKQSSNWPNYGKNTPTWKLLLQFNCHFSAILFHREPSYLFVCHSFALDFCHYPKISSCYCYIYLLSKLDFFYQ